MLAIAGWIIGLSPVVIIMAAMIILYRRFTKSVEKED